MLIEPESFSFENPKGFVVLEGVNGGGKSTLQKNIAKFLSEKKIPHVLTHEPGATAVGRSIRSLVLEHSQGKVSAMAELCLFGADRAEHIDKIIRPALTTKTFVISDRYLYSTIAFQGYGRGINMAAIESINQIATAGLLPDLVLLLDIDPLEGLQRTTARSAQGGDAFESENIAFHTKLREGFLKMAVEKKEAFFIIDAKQSEKKVSEQANLIIARLLQALGSTT